MLRIRCSSLGKIMATPAKPELSVGAKTYIETLAKEQVYGYSRQIGTKEIQKGHIVEAQSIALLNEVLFASHTKNLERKTNDWLSGECDITADHQIHDIKSSWSLATFPAFKADGADKLYEWQLRGYMMLWEASTAELDYCLVDTPDELIGFEDEALHRVSHIDPMLRVTRLPFTYDSVAAGQIRMKVESAQEYFQIALQQICDEHK